MDNNSYICKTSIGREESISSNKLSAEVKTLQTSVSARFRIKKLSSLQLGLHHFNPPPKPSSCKGDNEVLHQIREDLGG
jgi:hypothetical protein